MKDLIKGLFCIVFLPLMVIGGIYKFLLDLADEMDRSRRRKKRNLFRK